MAFRIFSTCGEAQSMVRAAIFCATLGLPTRPSAPCPLGRSLPMSCAPHLLPVGRDDADLLGRDTGAAPPAPALQQLLEVLDQHLDLSRVEERGALGLSQVFPANAMEDDGEALEVESVGLLACGLGLPPCPLPAAPLTLLGSSSQAQYRLRTSSSLLSQAFSSLS